MLPPVVSEVPVSPIVPHCPLSAAQVRQLHTFNNLTLGAVYLQTSFDKACLAKMTDPAGAVARLLTDPVRLGLLLLHPDDNMGWTTTSEMMVANQLQHFNWGDLISMGRRIRAALPVLPDLQAQRISALTAQVSTLTKQAATLQAALAAAKKEENQWRAHLRDAHEETSAARRRAARLQDQLNECDCEE